MDGKDPIVQMTQTSMLLHTKSNGFTFDSPVVTYFNIANNIVNAPVSHSFSVTVHGKNFGSRDESLTAFFGGYQCQNIQWNSDTSLVCGSSGGAGSAEGEQCGGTGASFGDRAAGGCAERCCCGACIDE